MNFLILGYGSIGNRHARNLLSLDHQCIVVEPNVTRLELALSHGHTVYSNIEDIKIEFQLDGVFICSPPVFHVNQTIWALSHGFKVFLEKPVGTNMLECQEVLKYAHHNIFVGYNYRWNPQFIKLQNDLSLGLIGKPYYANFVIGMHLEDWHPWENYRDFFMSSANLGGGALLDESHFLELIIELFGLPNAIIGLQSKISDLDIDADDYVASHFKYKDLLLDLSLDLFRRPHESYIEVYGAKGNLRCDFISKTTTLTSNESYAKFKSSQEQFHYSREEIFFTMLKDFLNFIESTNTPPRVSFLRGYEVMSLIDQIRNSSKSSLGRVIYGD